MEERLKDPGGTVPFTINWAPYLGTDTIASATWTVATGITKVSDSHTTTTTTVWLSGGTAGVDYLISCQITCVGGPPQIDKRSILIRVRQR
jgi:hypothetical protein